MKKILLIIVTMLSTVPHVWAAQSLTAQQWYTKGGAKVLFYPAMEVPMLDISIAFAAGSAYDGKAYGLSALTTRMLNQGSVGLTSDAIAEKLAETGAQYDAANNRDMILLNLKTLTKPDALKAASDLFATIMNHPDFPESAFHREKNQQLMAIAQALESPDAVADQTFFQTLYQNHPYAHPIDGDREHVAQLTLLQVRDFHQRFFVSSNAIIVLVGAIDKATAEQLAERVTESLPKGHAAFTIPEAKPMSEEMYVEVPFPSSQTVLRLGQLGINHHSSDYFPLLVGNYILGGGALVSRLALELREKRGLTYGVYSQFLPMPGLGPFLIGFSTKHSQAKAAIELTRKTLSSFIEEGPNEQELQAAKQYLTGSFPLSLASNRNIADMLLKKAFYHLPENYLDTYIQRINAVTVRDIKDAFQRQVTPAKLLQISVGKT